MRMSVRDNRILGVGQKHLCLLDKQQASKASEATGLHNSIRLGARAPGAFPLSRRVPYLHPEPGAAHGRW
ncbi:unnamed protein product [Arctogadus glacialis]